MIRMGESPLRVAIAAGGTAGHINPALALAEELRDRGHQVTFFGQTAKLEGTLVPQAGFDLVPVRVSGLDRSRPWTAISAGVRMIRARQVISRHFASSGRPDVAVGFGAYVEVPLGTWCASQGIPVILHEQNSVPGLANRMLAPRAERICVAFPAAREAFAGRAKSDESIVVTGNPVRRSVIEGCRERGREALGAGKDDFVLLVFGGSLGAQSLNECMVSLKDDLLARERLIICHATGKDGYDEISSELALSEEEGRRWRLSSYIDDMGDALAAADLVLSRAGASTVAEIAALAVPSVLVPYPFATADHQTTNARLLSDADAAVLVPDGDLKGDQFRELLLGLVDDPARCAKMRAAAAELGQDRAAATLADVVESAAAGA